MKGEMSCLTPSAAARPWRNITAIFACVLLLTACVGPTQPTPSASDAVAIETIIDEVKQALADVQNNLSTAALLQISKVTLTLQTIATKQIGGTFQVWVITLGGKWEKDATQQIDITLVPPKPGGSKNVSTQSLVGNLEKAIFSVAQGVRKAGRDPNPLNLSNLDVTLSFTIKAAAEGGAKVEILPLGPDLSGSVGTTAVQTLKLSFVPPPK